MSQGAAVFLALMILLVVFYVTRGGSNGHR